MPALAQKYVIGTRGSSSEALTNHLAFTWYPEYSLLALPMTICEGGDNGVYGSQLTFSGLMVFDATLELGFAEHGRVPHTIGQNVTCSNWCANTRSAQSSKSGNAPPSAHAAIAASSAAASDTPGA